MWKHELNDQTFIQIGNKSGLQIFKEFVFDLKSMHGQSLPDIESVKIKYHSNDLEGTIELADGSEITAGIENEIQVACKEGKLYVQHGKGDRRFSVSEIVIVPAAEHK